MTATRGVRDAARRVIRRRRDLVIAADGIHSALRRAALPRRGRAAVERAHRSGAAPRSCRPYPRRPHHDHGGRRRAEVRRLPARGCPAPTGWPASTSSPSGASRRRPRPRTGTAPSTPRRSSPLFADWRVRLARRAGRHRGGRRDPRVPDGRPRPASAVDVRAHDPARGCRARDLPERLERRLAGDHRRAHPRVPPGDCADGRRCPRRRTRRIGVPPPRACTR